MKRGSEDSFNTFCKFLKIMGKPLPLFLFAMIIHMVGDNLFNVTLSIFVKNVIEMAQGGDTGGFSQVLLWSIVAGVVSLLIFFIFGTIYDIEAKRGNAKVQRLVVEKAMRMPMSYYDTHHSGEIVSKLLNDADVASQIFTSRLRRVTTPIMSVIVYFVPMLLMNWRLAVSLFVVNVFSLVVNSKYIEPMKQLGRQSSEKKKNMTKGISSVVGGIKTIKMYPGCKRILENFKVNVNAYSKVREETVKKSAMLGGINSFFDVICALGFLMLSIYFVDNNMASLGSVAAIYTLYGSFSYNFLELGKYLPELMNCIARAQIVFEYLQAEEEAGILENMAFEEHENMTAGAVVELSDVIFDYDVDSPSKEASLYNHVNMAIPYGVSTAITGKTGCGKSTLLKLILGFYPLQGGNIKIMGKRLTDISKNAMRQLMAYVPQNPYLFGISVKENIRLGNLSATDEDVINAAKAANAHEFIMKLPAGYDTILKSGADNLSGGERQRIAIARAFVRNAPILLMDEATSSLDNENDNLVQEAIRMLKDKSTAIIVAHKPSTIAACGNKIAM